MEIVISQPVCFDSIVVFPQKPQTILKRQLYTSQNVTMFSIVCIIKSTISDDKHIYEIAFNSHVEII